VPVPAGAVSGNVVVSVGGTASNGVAFTVQPDTTPPTVPTGLTGTAVSSSQIDLSWTASTDNVGVTGYNVYRAGTQVGTSTSTTYQDTGLSASTTYSYTVAAFDAAGNTSAQSASASATTSATSPGGGIPSALGWYQIPNTNLESACPPSTDCKNVVAAWSGGVADTLRNRLIVWGGGHTDYSGNEVYALNLGTNPISITRLNNPSPVVSGCTEVASDGTPPSRHTYDGLAYIPYQDSMFSYVGSMAPSGCGTADTWTFYFGSLKWTNQNPPNYPGPNGGYGQADYDPNTRNVFAVTGAYGQLSSYNFGNNAWTALSSNGSVINNQATGRVDPKRKRFYIFGAGGIFYYDISGTDATYAIHTLTGTGCSGFTGAQAPGVAYDPVQDRMVGWAGGNTVFLYNMDTDSCTSVTFPNGPPTQQALGTYGRFRYFPKLNVFALVNDANQNAFTLRLTPTVNPAADADFASRCAASGVLVCEGFDDYGSFTDTNKITNGYTSGVYEANDNTMQGTMDTTNLVSGNGSLKFFIRPGSTVPFSINPAGLFLRQLGPDGNPTRFGQNSDLYMQFRLRIDPNMINFNWGSVSDDGWKVFIVYGPIPGPSCTGDQFVQENVGAGSENLFQGYTSCGAPALRDTSNDIQQGDYVCPASLNPNFTAPPCIKYVANTWITEYIHVHTGTFGTASSDFDWSVDIAPDTILKKFISLSNFSFNGGGPSTDALMAVILQPYFSGATASTTNPAGTMWFDELIVSTQPIAGPKF